MRARLSPARLSQSLPQSPRALVSASHVEGSSPLFAPAPSGVSTSVDSNSSFLPLPLPPVLPQFALIDQVDLTLTSPSIDQVVKDDPASAVLTLTHAIEDGLAAQTGYGSAGHEKTFVCFC